MYVYVGTICHNMNYVIQWGILSEQTDVRFLREVRNTSIYTVHYPTPSPTQTPKFPVFSTPQKQPILVCHLNP